MYLTQSLRRAAQLRGDRRATLYEGRERSWREVASRVERFAGALASLGVQPGDRVALLGKNSDAYIEWYYAVPWAGGISVPLNYRWSVAENVYALNDTAAEVLLIDDHFIETLPELRRRHPALQTVIHAGKAPTPEGALSYETLIDDAAPIEDRSAGPDAPFVIFYTGGTTGHPKGVTLSSLNLWASTATLITASELTARDRYLHCAPVFHLAGAAQTFAITAVGGSHVLTSMFEPGEALRLLDQERITYASLVPIMLQMVLQHPDFAGHDLSALERVLYGASPISDAVLQAAMRQLPQVRLVQAYGQTELSPIATILAPEFHTLEGPNAAKRTSAGCATFATEVRIVAEDGVEVPRGTVGEIACRGPNVMLGYWNRPDLTAKTIVDGWVRTGDAGRMDEDGFVFVVDRVKDMIITGAENVYSAEVENALMQHPAVDSCAVIGIPDARWGEAVHAVVVRKAGLELDDETLIAHARDLIAHYKCPRSVEFRDAMPLSAAGKILKRELREAYWPTDGRGVN
jgi:acyl-CoA synthetase (AMP-forming)/AMP-acid ligase II